MAKCIKHTKTGEVSRVSNDIAAAKVAQGDHKYIDKTKFKREKAA